MERYKLFSRRLRESQGEISDVFSYDVVPEPLINNIIIILNRTLPDDHYDRKEFLSKIINILREEWGIPLRGNDDNEILNKIFTTGNFIDKLDCIEVIFRAMIIFGGIISNNTYRPYIGGQSRTKAIKDFNYRCKYHNFGYQFEEGYLIRIDSKLLHQEVVKPALKLTSSSIFQNANEEFITAFDAYKTGDLQKAILYCTKAFESTMKIICSQKSWEVNNNATARALITCCIKNGLFPEYWDQQINALRNLLENAIPTPRNKLAGHGVGTEKPNVDNDLVSYILHMTASTIVFLINQSQK